MPRWLLIPLAWLAAVLLTAVAGALIQAQFNLAALRGLGLDIPLGDHLRTSLQDVAGFGPLWGMMAAVALLLAFPVAALLSRWKPQWRLPLYALAGFAGLLVAIMAANGLSPVPAFIAATRGFAGTLAMAASGAVGGCVFARLCPLPRGDS